MRKNSQKDRRKNRQSGPGNQVSKMLLEGGGDQLGQMLLRGQTRQRLRKVDLILQYRNCFS